ncbi:MAG: hypothetical protein WCE21_01880 [Candidatus Babeliales bacterium]
MKYIHSIILIACIASSYTLFTCQGNKKRRRIDPALIVQPPQIPYETESPLCGICENKIDQQYCTWFPSHRSTKAHAQCNEIIKPLYFAQYNSRMATQDMETMQHAHAALISAVRSQCRMPIEQYAQVHGTEQLKLIFEQLLQCMNPL